MLVVLVLATPAYAQQGGTVVLTPQVVNQLLTGLKAGEAERETARKEDSPYSRYNQEKAAYAAAKSKCDAAQANWPQRVMANPKLNDKYQAYIQKMMEATQKQDQKRTAAYQDSAAAMMSPSCLVKEPQQPSEYYDLERAIEVRAESVEVKASGMGRGELAMVKERSDAILRNSAGADISASEKSAVNAKAAELKELMGIQEQPAQRAGKTAPEPAAEAVAEPVSDTASGNGADAAAAAQANQMGSCMAKNMEKHKAEMEELQKQAEAAQKAGDTAKLIQIAQQIQQIQMAGCTGQ
jgi:hypothetical protein